jgi:hypothetical protein
MFALAGKKKLFLLKIQVDSYNFYIDESEYDKLPYRPPKLREGNKLENYLCNKKVIGF